MNEIAVAIQESVHAIGEIPRHLLHPWPIGLRDDSRNVNLARGQPNHEENVVMNQAEDGPQFYAEEVCRSQDLPMASEELLPSRPALTIWSGIDSGFLQYPADRSTADFVAEVVQRTLKMRV